MQKSVLTFILIRKFLNCPARSYTTAVLLFVTDNVVSVVSILFLTRIPDIDIFKENNALHHLKKKLPV